MPRFLLDTSCMVASLSPWQVHHAQALAEIERRLDRGEAMVLAGPALVETYSVLTRLPPPRRLSPADAGAVLHANYMGRDVEVVALDADSYRRLIRRAASEGIPGGRLYDAVILACAAIARVDALLTFDERHFRALAGGDIEIVVPS